MILHEAHIVEELKYIQLLYYIKRTILWEQ